MLNKKLLTSYIHFFHIIAATTTITKSANTSTIIAVVTLSTIKGLFPFPISSLIYSLVLLILIIASLMLTFNSLSWCSI